MFSIHTLTQKALCRVPTSERTGGRAGIVRHVSECLCVFCNYNAFIQWKIKLECSRLCACLESSVTRDASFANSTKCWWPRSFQWAVLVWTLHCWTYHFYVGKFYSAATLTWGTHTVYHFLRPFSFRHFDWTGLRSSACIKCWYTRISCIHFCEGHQWQSWLSFVPFR